VERRFGPLIPSWPGRAAATDESWQRTGSMPKQRLDHFIQPHKFTDDFSERFKRFQRESGLSWSEIARRIGTYRYTVWSWKAGRGRPNMKHIMALLDLAESLGLRHIFTD